MVTAPEVAPLALRVQRLDALHDAEGHNYQLARVFPHAPLSGFEWYVYRNLDPTVLPPVSR